jgi:hypothetical protein
MRVKCCHDATIYGSGLLLTHELVRLTYVARCPTRTDFGKGVSNSLDGLVARLHGRSVGIGSVVVQIDLPVVLYLELNVLNSVMSHIQLVRGRCLPLPNG